MPRSIPSRLRIWVTRYRWHMTRGRVGRDVTPCESCRTARKDDDLARIRRTSLINNECDAYCKHVLWCPNNANGLECHCKSRDLYSVQWWKVILEREEYKRATLLVGNSRDWRIIYVSSFLPAAGEKRARKYTRTNIIPLFPRSVFFQQQSFVFNKSIRVA